MLRRRLPGVLSVLLLILCGITVVLWVRSHFIRDRLRWNGKYDQPGVITWQVCSDAGRLIVEGLSYSDPPRWGEPPRWHGYEFAHGEFAAPWSPEPSHQTKIVDWYNFGFGSLFTLTVGSFTGRSFR